MLANIYEKKCRRCGRVSTVAVKIKPVTVTLTVRQATAALCAIFAVSGCKLGAERRASLSNAFTRLDTAIKQQTKPRRKSQ